MLFKTLTKYLDELEKTSSRLSLIQILSKLFEESCYEEVDKIIYLVQGRIAPIFEAIEMGMADKMVSAAIARAVGKTKEQVFSLYLKLGDMGLVAQDLVSKSVNNKFTVDDVCDVLLKIAKTSGEGTVEKKVVFLSDLLKRVDSLSAKHLVRIPLGNLRLGIGDPTILDALSKFKFGAKTDRHFLETAYNRTSDLGLIAKTLYLYKDRESTLKTIAKINVVVGKPIRSELCERLPGVQKVIEKMIKVNAQEKFDGFRCQIHKNKDKVSIFSRNLENMTNMFPELLEAVKKDVKADSVILDSEALAYNPDSDEFLPFQETTKRRRKYNIEQMAKDLPLRAFVFDILYLNGKQLLDTPLWQRMELLVKAIPSVNTLIPSPGKIIDNPEDLQIMLDNAISKGLEGLVVKKIESVYEAGGRNFNWVKLKRTASGQLNDTIDCVVLGYINGKGKRTSFGAGALLVGLYDDKKDEFVTVSRIGTGLSDKEWHEIHRLADKISLKRKPARVNSIITPSVWISPSIVIEVLADEITRSPIHTAGKIGDQPGYALRFPRLITFRSKDKKPEDSTSVTELIEMYKRQILGPKVKDAIDKA